MLLRNVVVQHGQVRQFGQRRQCVQVGEVPQRVVGEHEHRQVRDELLQIMPDAGDPVVGKQ